MQKLTIEQARVWFFYSEWVSPISIDGFMSYSSARSTMEYNAWLDLLRTNGLLVESES